MRKKIFIALVLLGFLSSALAQTDTLRVMQSSYASKNSFRHADA